MNFLLFIYSGSRKPKVFSLNGPVGERSLYVLGVKFDYELGRSFRLELRGLVAGLISGLTLSRKFSPWKSSINLI